ncbi:hypothetical protein CEK71_19710 [Methylovulum psychrotolerans]|uniref:Protein CR006 P-loop domain-containing protein n=1 Tax=Methylovulum psychrotolerans TaxID=1704499 RepID=A0A1Z4C5M5_9GAMM|nr:hypothetical protein CEK71_19710 [Methylovulum psychrotolerans]
MEGAETLKSVSIFNDNYINQFVFKQSEVINNSFDIFIRNDDYKEKIQKIEHLISGIKETFKNNENLEQIIKDLTGMSEGFGSSKSGIDARASIAKGIGKGNKIENIPAGLEAYSDYLKNEANIKWIKWQIEGNNFVNISENCPYCTSPTKDKKESIKSVGAEYDAKSIEHLNKILGIVESLGIYFNDDTNNKLIDITKNKTGLSTEEKNYLIEIKGQIDVLKNKLITLKGMTFFTLSDVDKVADKIKDLKIDIGLLSHLNATETVKIVNEINNSIDSVLNEAGKLQGEIIKQKNGIQKTIKEHKEEINKFLRFAGYKYLVDIENDGEEYKMRLKHEDSPDSVKGEQCLSYGEKNAFSLVLFMYENLSKNPDLIVLDDPISSFDKNKKFAIIDMLFRRKKSFNGKTVMMMTHDLEPMIDMVKTLHRNFAPIPMASFLESKDGIVRELEVKASDIMTFTQICNDNTESQSGDIIKLIYLRRYYEIISDKGLEYQLLSSLFHKESKPTIKLNQTTIEMSPEEIINASDSIKSKIPTFDYGIILGQITNKNEMLLLYKDASNNYEKLQIFRIITEHHDVEYGDNAIIKKYFNETFHIENEYIMQLNPCKYEIIPQFIIKECDLSLLSTEII